MSNQHKWQTVSRPMFKLKWWKCSRPCRVKQEHWRITWTTTSTIIPTTPITIIITILTTEDKKTTGTTTTITITQIPTTTPTIPTITTTTPTISTTILTTKTTTTTTIIIQIIMEGVGIETIEIIQGLSNVGHMEIHGIQEKIAGIRKMDIMKVQLWKTEKVVLLIFSRQLTGLVGWK